MCGLVGIITKKGNGFSKDQVDAFDDLLYLDALRGMDSTGVFLVDRDGGMEMCKEASPAQAFRRHGDYKSILDKAFRSGRALVGHNRAATRGSITDENAHPFVVDDRITLVHNGTLFGDYKKLANVDVDSHAIAHVIHENDGNVEKAIQKIDGAFALIWHDFKQNTLNILRNSQRPIHFMETDDAYYWASEANMLSWIVARYQLKIKSGINLLEDGVLTTYTFTNSSWEVDSKKIKLSVTPSYPVTNYLQNTRSHYHNLDDWPDDDMPFVQKNPSCDLENRPNLEVANKQVRIISAEATLAKENGMNIPIASFGEVSALIKDSSYHAGICLDYQTVAPSDPSLGYFLYARLEENNNFLIKLHLEADYVETDLMTLCYSNSRCLFRITSRIWRAWPDKTYGEHGFGMFTATSFKELENKGNVIHIKGETIDG